MIEKQKLDRYEMHKYWGKKPANDAKNLIEKYSKEGDTILDPFSGYGVFCCEAFLLKRNVISNDLNPIANFINKQLLNKDVDLKKIEFEWKNIKNELSPYIQSWYGYDTGDEKVQLINILRDNLDNPVKARFKTIKENKTKEITFSEDYAQSYLDFENKQQILDWYPSDGLIENSRISAKKGMTIPDLFTKRALACHARLLSLIEKYSSGNEKSLLKLAFTANLANCSKLVPPIKSRGDMAQGAWMTGFYIGDTYLENNVLLYFENRLEKIIKGKNDYLKYFNHGLFNDYNNTFQVTQCDAKRLQIPSESVDYVFTDPPYGDAVPYFEQSIIWNSWLKFNPNYSDEIVISDSKTRKKDIESFESEIFEAFSEIRRVLKLGGYFSLTYHSLSGLEWRAITNACIKNGFQMVGFNWLVQKSFTPRQINRSKSIKGDVLITFRKKSSTRAIVKTDSETESLYIQRIHNWLRDKPRDTNEVFLNIMKMIFEENILIGDIDLLDVLSNHFTFTQNQQWIIKQEVEVNII